jgi:hypothetical protein
LTWAYKTGGQAGKWLEGQNLIELAFTLHKTVDELLDADTYWVNRMLIDLEARKLARRR